MQVKASSTFVAMLAIGLVLSLAFAAAYATQNQATYLLDPMQRAMPELFRRDWFVSETPPYLPVFGWLAQWLFVIDPAGPAAFIAAHVVVTVATYAAIYWLASTVRAGLAGFTIVASTVAITTVLTMGGHYLVAGYLQPSSLATLGWIVALAAFARDRYWLCGIAAALGGALHANFLVLGIGTFALAAIARRDVRARDIATLLVPQLAVLALFLPPLLAAAGPTDDAIWILTHFHAPRHYAGARLAGWIPDAIAWQLAAAAAYAVLRGDKPARALWWFSIVTCAIAVGSALVILVPAFEALTQVRPSRIAPLGQLASLALVAAALVRCAGGGGTRRQRVWLALALLAPLSSMVARSQIGWLAALVGFAAMALLLCEPRVPRAAFFALAGSMLVYALWASPRGAGLTTTPRGSTDELAVTRWAATHTPVDALFLSPPGMDRFRVLSRRAIVADIKSPPLRPDLLVQWYYRLGAMVRMPGAARAEALDARYKQLTRGELLAIARGFGADFIVVTSANPAWPDAPVFDSPRLKVYAAEK